ncbi:MAG TPA: trypsin-like peptidase domain-containing protein, partial [Streptosporangiaceae bacterium]
DDTNTPENPETPEPQTPEPQTRDLPPVAREDAAEPAPTGPVPTGPEPRQPDFLGPYAGAPGDPGQPTGPPQGPPPPWPPIGGAAMGGPPPHPGGTAGSPPYGGPPYAGAVPGGGGGPRQPNRWLRWTVAGVGALVLFVGAGAGGAAVALHYGGGATTLPAVQPAQGTSNTTGGTTVAKVAKAVSPSVVAITVDVANGEVQGSGVIMKSDGTILTNNHVVADAANGGTITVQFSDGKKVSASILGRDPSTDLAVIKAKGASGLTPAAFADSGSVQVGDSVIAIGSPLGLNGSVTSGIVSALNRSITLSEDEDQNQGQGQNSPFGQGLQQQQQQQSTSTVVSAIQTDAAINPGNSGGPLLNSAGQVIGINTAIAGTSGQESSGSQSGNIGVGFAIPSSQAHDVAQQLISKGKATHAYLGIGVTDSASSSGSGAVVASVANGGPADHAGLKKGDVVTKLDGKSVSDSGSLVAYIRSKASGDKVTVTYTRGGTSHTVTVTLSEKAG